MSNHQSYTASEVDMGFTTERFPLGTHMCYLYNDEAERREVMAQYINKGLATGEYVGYFADVESDDFVDRYLAAIGIHLPAGAQQSRTYFQRARNVYCPHNHFSPEFMLKRLKHLHDDCHDCCGQLRVTGEMSWALAPEVTGTERLVEYESRLNLLMATHPFTAICQYNANSFDGVTIFEILKVHPMMVVRGQVVRNPYYIPPQEYLVNKGLLVEMV